MRSRQRKQFAPKRRNQSPQKLLKIASSGALDLIQETIASGIDIDITKLPRSGAKGNIIKSDVQAYLKAHTSSMSSIPPGNKEED